MVTWSEVKELESRNPFVTLDDAAARRVRRARKVERRINTATVCRYFSSTREGIADKYEATLQDSTGKFIRVLYKLDYNDGGLPLPGENRGEYLAWLTNLACGGHVDTPAYGLITCHDGETRPAQEILDNVLDVDDAGVTYADWRRIEGKLEPWDMLINNADRHEYNALWRSTRTGRRGKVVAIDHGRAFWPGRPLDWGLPSRDESARRHLNANRFALLGIAFELLTGREFEDLRSRIGYFIS